MNIERVELINTGTELLMGSVLNTNAAWIGEQLFKQGVRLEKQVTVPDGESILEVMREAAFRSSIVFVTGGLGPTSDDVTREALAELCGVDLEFDASAFEQIKAYFGRRGLDMSASNKRQAMVPAGAEVLQNHFGTAPGLWMPACEKTGRGDIILLPGPPRELRPMMEQQVLPLLADCSVGCSFGMQLVKVVGIGESSLQDLVDDSLAGIHGLEYGYCARTGEVDVRLVGESPLRKKAIEVLESLVPDLMVKPYGASLEEAVVQRFSEKKMKLAVAESCTGGLIAKRLTDVSGASLVFEYGFVTYANEAKERLLSVSHELLEQHGAVSEEVAKAMAEGALAVSGADVAVAVTGVAGPTGGTEEKPVGTVWMAWAFKGKPTESKKGFYPTDREAFRQMVSQQIFYRLVRV